MWGYLFRLFLVDLKPRQIASEINWPLGWFLCILHSIVRFEINLSPMQIELGFFLDWIREAYFQRSFINLLLDIVTSVFFLIVEANSIWGYWNMSWPLVSASMVESITEKSCSLQVVFISRESCTLLILT